MKKPPIEKTFSKILKNLVDIKGVLLKMKGVVR
jgi:hypothetical protein